MKVCPLIGKYCIKEECICFEERSPIHIRYYDEKKKYVKKLQSSGFLGLKKDTTISINKVRVIAESGQKIQSCTHLNYLISQKDFYRLVTPNWWHKTNFDYITLRPIEDMPEEVRRKLFNICGGYIIV